MILYRRHNRRFVALLLALLILIILLSSALTSQVRADSIYSIPDLVYTSPGAFDMAVNNGNPVLSYYSAVTNKTVVAVCGNSSCETALTVIHPIESINISDVAVTVVNGNPFIAYTTGEVGTERVRVAACVDALCSQPLVITTIASAAGGFGNIAMTLQNGKALIVYEVIGTSGHNTLTLAGCNNATCTAPTLRSLSVTDGVSGSHGLALGLLNSNPIIVYQTFQANSPITLLKCLSSTCSETPTLKTVDATVSNVSGISMAVAASTPIITYSTVEGSSRWLKAATCTDSTCTGSVHIHTIDQGPYFTSVALVNNQPVIAYYHDGLRLATCLDIPCDYSSSTVFASGDPPIVRASQNDPVVAFLKYMGGKYAIQIYYGGDFTPSQSSTPSATNTPTVYDPTSIALSATSTLTSLPATLTPSITPTPSITWTPSITFTPTKTPTNTATDTPTATNTVTNTVTFTPTDTPTFTPTNTATNSPTDTPTFTPTNTATDTPTATNTVTNTVTFIPSNAPTDTPTPLPGCDLNASIISISENPSGTQGNGPSFHPYFSSSDRYIAYESSASNLVSGDTNGKSDVFLYDRMTCQTIRASVAANGTQANNTSVAANVSSDGRYVAFTSLATNLTSGDSDNLWDVYIKDLQTGTVTRLAAGIASNTGSVFFVGDSDSVIFTTANNISLYEIQTQQLTVLVTAPGLELIRNAASRDLRYLVFSSQASNLVANDTNNASDVFLLDRQKNQISRVSVSSAGLQANDVSNFATISADGRYVVFNSSANNLVSPDIVSGIDLYIRDLQTNTTSRVALSNTGEEGNLPSGYGSISDDDRYVAFISGATNLVSGDNNNQIDVFIRDLQTNQTYVASSTTDGVFANDQSDRPTISHDGNYVAFGSLASNLVAGDTNNFLDVFVVKRPVFAPATPTPTQTDTPMNPTYTPTLPSQTPEPTNTLPPTPSPTTTPVTPTSAPNVAPPRNFYTTLPVTLTWSPVSWATSYEIQISTDPTFNPATIDLDLFVPADKRTYTFEELATDTYYWRVRALNGSTVSAWSKSDSFVLSFPPSPTPAF